MPEDKNNSNDEKYNNPKYCLENFIAVLKRNGLEINGKILKFYIFKGVDYTFPDCYDEPDRKFWFCTDDDSKSKFPKRASYMVYEKYSRKGRTSLLNGDSLTSLVGRLIAQYYMDEFRKFERFFRDALRISKTADMNAIIAELVEMTRKPLGEDVSDERKLVYYMIWSFHPGNMVVYDAGIGKQVPVIQPLRVRAKGMVDAIWQIANAFKKDERTQSCSRFAHDFELNEQWLNDNCWPLSDYIDKSESKYMVKHNGKPVSINSILKEIEVSSSFFPDKLIEKLVDVYVSPGRDRLREALSEAFPDDKLIYGILNSLRQLSSEGRKRIEKKIIVELNGEQAKLEIDNRIKKGTPTPELKPKKETDCLRPFDPPEKTSKPISRRTKRVDDKGDK